MPRVIAGVSLSVVVLVALVALAADARTIVSANTPNATGALGFPSWLDRLTQRSSIAYPTHAALATMLEAAKLSPAATSVQWFKAAAHTRSDAETEQAARGISAALMRDGDDDRALRTLCLLGDLANVDQARVIRRVDPNCDRWPPAVDLEAVVTPHDAAPGSVVSIAVSMKSATDLSGLVDVEIYDESGRRIAQWVISERPLAAEQGQHYAVDWAIPPGLPTGEYVVKLGVFSDDWTETHGWKNAAAVIAVSSRTR